MQVSIVRQGYKQLSMTEDELRIIRNVASYISQEFSDLDFWTVKNTSKAKVDGLSSLLSAVAPVPNGVTLEIDTVNFEVLFDVMDFADGFLNEEFESDHGSIIEITNVLLPARD
ncbi:MAG: hypothetical protein P0119_06350 [Nitrospira sp.]|nr:hypothetical protein [Nitrospira sp.]